MLTVDFLYNFPKFLNPNIDRGPTLYPIFNGPNLVGYTMNNLTFNPSLKTDNDENRITDEIVSLQ